MQICTENVYSFFSLFLTDGGRSSKQELYIEFDENCFIYMQKFLSQNYRGFESAGIGIVGIGCNFQKPRVQDTPFTYNKNLSPELSFLLLVLQESCKSNSEISQLQ
jgi:hypothetical protein